MTNVEWYRACSDLIEIQWWDVMDDRYHSYLVEGEKMMDEVIANVAEMLDEMPQDCKVYICCGDVNRLCDMQMEFEDYGVVDIVFITPTDVLKGHLRGRLGALIIIDLWLMTDGMRECLYREQEIMKATLPRNES